MEIFVSKKELQKIKQSLNTYFNNTIILEFNGIEDKMEMHLSEKEFIFKSLVFVCLLFVFE